MSKILLVNPPFNVHDPKRGVELVFPLGLGYIAAVLKGAGYEDIEILDTVVEGKGHYQKYNDTKFFSFGMPERDIEKRIKAACPEVVGITCSFTKRFTNVLDTAKIVKRINPNIKVVVGGAHPSAMPQEVANYKEIDYVIIGEGEASFLKLMNHLLRGEGELIDIDGIAYKYNGGKARLNPKTKFISDLDTIPFPYRDIFPMDVYIGTKRNSVITSRGCPFNCSFCSIHCVWGDKWRARSAENVVDEIQSLIEKYKIEFISFDDDNLTFDRERARKIFQEMVMRRLKIFWNTPNGVSILNLDKGLLKIMKDSGCFALNLAIESGDRFILNKVMKKATSLEKVREVVKDCKDLGILTLGYFVIGMPGETKESLKRSFDFAKELMIDVINVFIATPYPGSRLYKECLEKGYLNNEGLFNYTAFDAVIDTPYLSASQAQDFLSFFLEEYNKYHDKHSDIPTAEFKEAIRRPTKGLIRRIQSALAARSQ